MNTDVRIGTNYPNHPKIRKLKRILGADGVMSHTFLLCFTAQTCPSGVLRDMDAEDIAQVAQWRGDPDEFVQTLLNLRLLDQNSLTYAIHNWPKHNYYCMTAEARSEIARQNANKRWEKKRKGNQGDDANGITDSNADSNAPSPPPSLEGEGEAAPFEQESSPPTSEAVLSLAKEIATKHDCPDVESEISRLLDEGCSTAALYFAAMLTRNSYNPKGEISARGYFQLQLDEKLNSS